MGSSTIGWKPGNYLKTKVKHPVVARAHFLQTWRMPGLRGLMRSRYRPPPGAPDVLNDLLRTTFCPTGWGTDGMDLRNGALAPSGRDLGDRGPDSL